MTDRGPPRQQSLFDAPTPMQEGTPSPPTQRTMREPPSKVRAPVEIVEVVVVAPPPPPKPEQEEPRVFSVSQLGRVIGRSLDKSFASAIWVEGEVTGARPAASGHIYLCLKDEEEEASIDVVLYRGQVTPRARALIKDGARLKVRAKPTFWSPRGRLQLIGDRVEATGQGAILEAIEKLKAMLMAEGLFAAERKRPLPPEPRIVGVVSSRSGAVIHDIVKVAFRRGGAHILLAPAQVQGLGSAESIRRGLAALQRIPDVDVIILARGGGSSDDLLSFHDEQLVRDVAACRVPVVSAVGHEVDVTLVDFAADARAATPSQAAEMVIADSTHLRRLLEERSLRLRRAIQARITEERIATERLTRAFRDPRLLIASSQQSIDDAMTRMTRVMNRQIARDRDTSTRLAHRLSGAHPKVRIGKDRARAATLSVTLTSLTHSRIARDRAKLGALAARLDAMSPLAVLSRGYAIATKEGRAIRSSSEVTNGDTIEIRVGQGSLEATVTEIK